MVDRHGRLEAKLRSHDPFEDRYELGENLGVGAYGLIVRATDRRDRGDVALKVIPPKACQRKETAVERFRREMKIIRQLDHPNIIAINDWGRTDDGLIYMVLEYVDGRTLDAVVGDRPLDKEGGAVVLDQLAAALEVAHDIGVIHRDLKPANVMLADTDGESAYRVKVLDFGLAKMLSGADDSSMTQLTAEGMAVGTPRYIAPEQASGREVGPTADLYTVGLLAYEMFTGRQAVPGDTVEEVIETHVSSEPLELRGVEEIPTRLRPIVYKLVDKDPDRRFQSAARLREALEDALQPQPVYEFDTDQLEVGPPLGDVEGDFPGAGPRGEDGATGSSDAGVSGRPAGPRGIDRSSDQPGSPEAGGEEVDDGSGDEPLLDSELVEQGRRSPARESVKMRERAARDDDGAFDWLVAPRRTAEWVETVAAVVLAALAFMALGAVAAPLGQGGRFLAGTAPVVGAALWAMLGARGGWNQAMIRRLWMVSAVAVIVPHLIDARGLATELTRNPAWFLAPVEGLPGAGAVEDGVVWLSRQWAGVVFDLLA